MNNTTRRTQSEVGRVNTLNGRESALRAGIGPWEERPSAAERLRRFGQAEVARGSARGAA